MTDPSYRGQILVFTTPLIGNYGVPYNIAPRDSRDVGVVLESSGVQCAAVVVTDVAEKFSHYTAIESLHSWCSRYNVPGLTGVDTRAITRLLRDQGTTLGRLAVGDDAALPPPMEDEYWDPSQENLVDQISTKEPYVLNPTGDVRIAVLDFGAKANIARALVRRGAAVTVLPWDFDFNYIRDGFDGLFLSNGPGDPQHCWSAAQKLRTTMDEWRKPIFGICMGHQIIGMAAGLDAYRMTFGNRGHNQPVLALASSGSIRAGRVYVTRFASFGFFRRRVFLLSGDAVKIISMPYNYRTPSQKGGNHFSSTATIRRWKVSSQRPIRVVVYGAYSSILRARAGLSILWR
jgi:carbamoyl-phosphate synthase small subunit